MPLTSSELGDSIKRTFRQLDEQLRGYEKRIAELEREVKHAKKIITRSLKHAAPHMPESLVLEAQAFIHDPEEGSGRG